MAAVRHLGFVGRILGPPAILTKFGSVTQLALYSEQTVKISNFWNPKWRRPPSWKSQKFRYLRNGLTDFAIFCEALSIGSLNRFDQKNWISKIQHGRRPPFWKPQNCHISDRFWFNLALRCMLVLSAWRKVHFFLIFNNLIWQIAAGWESKNCLSIFCNYTKTHYTILTIKQQILTVKTAVYL